MNSPDIVSTRILTVPNVISSARLSLVPIFVWAALTGRNTLAFILLAVVGSTDWVDGYVARRTGQVSVLGKLLDPVADRVAIVAVLSVFAFQQVIPWSLAVIILSRDLLVAVVFAIVESRGVPRIEVNFVGKTATALIYTGTAFAAAGRIMSPSDEQVVRMIAVAMLAAGAALYWISVAMYAAAIRKKLVT
ncbi:MAG: CDP-alcohol phosphatidyltransferase family protein [Actinomycetota bacterium]